MDPDSSYSKYRNCLHCSLLRRWDSQPLVVSKIEIRNSSLRTTFLYWELWLYLKMRKHFRKIFPIQHYLITFTRNYLHSPLLHRWDSQPLALSKSEVRNYFSRSTFTYWEVRLYLVNMKHFWEICPNQSYLVKIYYMYYTTTLTN